MSTAKQEDVCSLAERLFAAKRSVSARFGTRDDAVAAFKEARAFLDVRADFESGKLDARPSNEPELSDVSCPNERKTHPHNMVSKRFGDLNRVKKILDELKSNPTIQAYSGGEIEWTPGQTDLARLIFPTYVGAN